MKDMREKALSIYGNLNYVPTSSIPREPPLGISDLDTISPNICSREEERPFKE
jgi:hypothetical protein